MKIDLIAAARPNFMKVAPLFHRLNCESWCTTRVVHTGQHYDPNMSEAFFHDLQLPSPDLHLEVGSASHARQTAQVMTRYEEACERERPDLIVVVGDVNSTLACALVGAKQHIRVAHLEAGLRSGDRTMPEEINRLVTDTVSDILWTPSADADENLRREGIPRVRVSRVGNIMIDCYELMRERIACSPVGEHMGLRGTPYGVVTLHRPANVDHEDVLTGMVTRLEAIGERLPLIFPVHPRTRERLERFGMLSRLESSRIRVIDPLGYVDFMALVSGSRLAITDSGGIQEETTYLGIPCLTLRDTTERPITVTEGTNRLVTVADLESNVDAALRGEWPRGRKPLLWDGKTAERVAADIRKRLCGEDVDGRASEADAEPAFHTAS